VETTAPAQPIEPRYALQLTQRRWLQDVCNVAASTISSGILPRLPHPILRGCLADATAIFISFGCCMMCEVDKPNFVWFCLPRIIFGAFESMGYLYIFAHRCNCIGGNKNVLVAAQRRSRPMIPPYLTCVVCVNPSNPALAIRMSDRPSLGRQTQPSSNNLFKNPFLHPPIHITEKTYSLNVCLKCDTVFQNEQLHPPIFDALDWVGQGYVHTYFCFVELCSRVKSCADNIRHTSKLSVIQFTCSNPAEVRRLKDANARECRRITIHVHYRYINSLESGRRGQVLLV